MNALDKQLQRAITQGLDISLECVGDSVWSDQRVLEFDDSWITLYVAYTDEDGNLCNYLNTIRRDMVVAISVQHLAARGVSIEHAN